MNEHLDVDNGVSALDSDDGRVQAGEGIKVLVLCVDDPDECTELTEDMIEIKSRVKEVELAWKVPDMEVHERAVWPPGRFSKQLSYRRNKEGSSLDGVFLDPRC